MTLFNVIFVVYLLLKAYGLVDVSWWYVFMWLGLSITEALFKWSWKKYKEDKPYYDR